MKFKSCVFSGQKINTPEILGTKILIFYKEFKLLVKSFHTQFLKQSMVETSEALHKVEGMKKTTTSVHK